MGLIGHMVTHNELDRYLPATLDWLGALTNGRVAVYDDQSTDGTVDHVKDLGLHVTTRPDTVTSFADDESAFRGAAWRWMEQSTRPGPGDWVLCIDADEFLVANDRDATCDTVIGLLEDAIAGNETAVTFRVAEVFARDVDLWPLIRTDGYWGAITACRLVAWRPGALFAPRREGGGSIPSNWRKPEHLSDGLSILHYGYAHHSDRVARSQRYTTTVGHNPTHIASISLPPNLRPWTGQRTPLPETRSR